MESNLRDIKQMLLNKMNEYNYHVRTIRESTDVHYHLGTMNTFIHTIIIEYMRYDEDPTNQLNPQAIQYYERTIHMRFQWVLSGTRSSTVMEYQNQYDRHVIRLPVNGDLERSNPEFCISIWLRMPRNNLPNFQADYEDKKAKEYFKMLQHTIGPHFNRKMPTEMTRRTLRIAAGLPPDLVLEKKQ
jgi:hypothetical protein